MAAAFTRVIIIRIEAIKLRSPFGLKPCVCFDGAEKVRGEWRVDAFEELQEDEAN
jgi:hypothetical protein